MYFPVCSVQLEQLAECAQFLQRSCSCSPAAPGDAAQLYGTALQHCSPTQLKSGQCCSSAVPCAAPPLFLPPGRTVRASRVRLATVYYCCKEWPLHCRPDSGDYCRLLALATGHWPLVTGHWHCAWCTVMFWGKSWDGRSGNRYRLLMKPCRCIRWYNRECSMRVLFCSNLLAAKGGDLQQETRDRRPQVASIGLRPGSGEEKAYWRLVYDSTRLTFSLRMTNRIRSVKVSAS